MNIQLVVSAVLVTGLLLLVATLGLQADRADATALLRQPKRLLRSLASMLVIMPIVAAALAHAFELERAVEIALVALALSPVPPFLPPRNIKAGGEASYAIGLLVATSLVSIVYVPLALALFELFVDVQLDLPVWRVIVPVGWSVFLPLLAGLLVKRLAPDVAARVAGPVGRLASLLLLVGLIPLLVTQLPKAIPLVGNGTLAVMLAFCLIGLAVGHLLGGPAASDRMTLALSTAARHPGVAMAIVKANFPGQTLVFPVVLLYIVLSTIVTLPYIRWVTRQTTSSPAPTGPSRRTRLQG